MPRITPGLYRHYKGGRYEVIGIGKKEDTLEDLVFYRSLQDKGEYKSGSLWVRTLKVFTETVELNGQPIARFAPLPKPAIPFAIRDIIMISIFPFLVEMINITSYSLFPLQSEKYQVENYLHFLGGLSITFSTGYVLRLLEKNGLVTIKNRLLKALQIIAVVMMIAVLWEIYEFTSDTFLGTDFQPNNFDTMKDLILGTLGGIFYCLTLVWGKK